MALVARITVDRRASERHPAQVDTTLRRTPREPHDSMIVEISTSGCRFVAVEGVAQGDQITLGLPGIGMRHAKVLRNSDGLCACTFVPPLSGDQLRAILAEPDSAVVDFVPDDPVTSPVPTLWDYPPPPPPERLPLGYRVLIIVGSSLVLWGTIIGIAVAIWSALN